MRETTVVQTVEQIKDQLEVIETKRDSQEEETTDRRVAIETTEDDEFHFVHIDHTFALLLYEFKLELQLRTAKEPFPLRRKGSLRLNISLIIKNQLIII